MKQIQDNGPIRLSRRQFLAAMFAAGVCPSISGCRKRPIGAIRKALLLGIDGMSGGLLERYIAEGRMPNAARLIQSGSLARLETTHPPLSPVAWSSFITGAGPETHGIYDFVTRDPTTYTAQFSLAGLHHGLRGESVVNRREGTPFWDTLERDGVPCTLLRIPCEYPQTSPRGHVLAGMGTPDIRGGYGSFTLFTAEPGVRSHAVPGGEIISIPAGMATHDLALGGPAGHDGRPATVRLRATVSTDGGVVDIALGDQRVLLRTGEWSGWLRVRFPLGGARGSVGAICRLAILDSAPYLRLYVSPINIDPGDAGGLPLSTPRRLARELDRALGPFHTQGLPADTAALSAGVFSDADYREQAMFVCREELRLLDHALDGFRDGLLFVYLSVLDQNSHMFWRALDRRHPLHNRHLAAEHGDFPGDLYAQMDAAIGKVMRRAGNDDLVMVFSDHGFGSFRRQFNLNSWLLANGFATLRPGVEQEAVRMLDGFDWGRTAAYGLGINGLYLNREGREAEGRLSPGDAGTLLPRLRDALLEARDPATGAAILADVHVPPRTAAGHLSAPDLVLGYADGYRSSWDTVLGGCPRATLADNLDPWSGDHAMAPSLVPGVLMASRPAPGAPAGIWDLAPSLLRLFGTERNTTMTGRAIWPV